jgi:hypothetical protein
LITIKKLITFVSSNPLKKSQMKTIFKFKIFALLVFLQFNVNAQVPSYVPSSGLKAWLGFNGNANDLSSNGNNATNTGATFIADRNGNAASAASFNGTSNYMQITTPSFTFTPTGAFSYSLWMNKQTQSTAAGIVLMSGTNTTGVFITLIQGASNFSFGTNKQQSAWINTSCAHTLNVWDHYVTTFNAGIMKIYKNGVFQSTATYSHIGATSSVIPFMIGRGLGGNSTCYKGALDDIGIWNRELTQIEINALYSSITNVSNIEREEKVEIFPNPASDFITLKTNFLPGENTYQIIDLQGKIVLSGALNPYNAIIDIRNLAQGTYFIEFPLQKQLALKFIKV